MKQLIAIFALSILALSAKAVVFEPGTVIDRLCGVNILEASFVDRVCLADSFLNGEKNDYVRIYVDGEALEYKVLSTRPLPSFFHNQNVMAEWQLEAQDGSGEIVFLRVESMLQEIYPNIVSLVGHTHTGLAFEVRGVDVIYNIMNELAL